MSITLGKIIIDNSWDVKSDFPARNDEQMFLASDLKTFNQSLMDLLVVKLVEVLLDPGVLDKSPSTYPSKLFLSVTENNEFWVELYKDSDNNIHIEVGEPAA